MGPKGMEIEGVNGGQWTKLPLPLPQHTHSKHDGPLPPAILIRPDFHTTGYSLTITDLSHIWVEQLSDGGLVARAEEINCSIDPSDADNRTALLKKLSECIRPEASDGGKHRISDNRSGGREKQQSLVRLSSNADGSVLTLHFSATLPAPLPRLVWKSYLTLQPAPSISNHLVLPLLSHAYTLHQQQAALVRDLTAKDRVIGRLCDRLEVSGDSLTAVFPGRAGLRLRKGESQRVQLSRFVEGLSDFEEESWRKTWADREQDSKTDVVQQAESVLGQITPAPHEDAARGEREWWRTVKPELGSKETLAPEDAQGQASTPAVNNIWAAQSSEESKDDDDGDFQRQSTPPGRQDLPKEQNPTANDVDSTDDEDDLDKPPSQAHSNPQHPHSSPVDRTSGNLAHRARAWPSPRPKSTRGGKLGTFGGAKRSIEKEPRAGDPVTSSELVGGVETPEQAGTKNPKLGMMGGRSKGAPAATGGLEQGPTDAQVPHPKAKQRLGTIGGRKKDSNRESSPIPHSSETGGGAQDHASIEQSTGATMPTGETFPGRAPAEPDHRSSRSTVPASQESKPEQPRETSQERADRKREALKRELEDQAKAAAKKKKRKF